LIDETDMPLVLDGGALRLLGTYPALRSNIVLTPHDGEFTALTGERPGADRFAAARDLAQRTGATVLLKGPLTIVAAPNGRCLVANRGDQRLATPGTGDVLAGTVGAMLAGGLEPAEAAAVAAWLHGEAGRTQASVGMVASDLLSGLSQVMSGLMSNSSHGGTGASN
jgi:NAD(P)H-hydrate epimerase